ncbi:unnamed protein product [Didymodactylos carnosus]|nr:unnamed protein product [Didymodactylos carnosus]CAF4447736.1 unnamed protein product [Didymodactylos carnosus]
MDPSIDHLEKLKSICAKLKKGLLPLRRPKYAEAANDFQSLAKQFLSENCLEYSALCYLQASKCFQELKSSTSELQTLLEAAHLFLVLELQTFESNTLSYNENLSLALSTYQMAQKNLHEQNERYLSGLISLQIADFLIKLSREHEAERLYNMTLDSFKDMTMIYIIILQHLLNIRIENNDHVLALNTCTQIIERLMGSTTTTTKTSTSTIKSEVKQLPTDVPQLSTLRASDRLLLGKCDVTRLLLLLILKPHPQRLRSDYAKVLNQYTWDSYEQT